MNLEEYVLNGRTYLFDSADVPEGAERVSKGEVAEVHALFEERVIEANPLIAKAAAQAAEREHVAELESEVARLTAALAAALAAANEPAEKQAPAPANKQADAPATKE